MYALFLREDGFVERVAVKHFLSEEDLEGAVLVDKIPTPLKSNYEMYCDEKGVITYKYPEVMASADLTKDFKSIQAENEQLKANLLTLQDAINMLLGL